MLYFRFIAYNLRILLNRIRPFFSVSINDSIISRFQLYNNLSNFSSVEHNDRSSYFSSALPCIFRASTTTYLPCIYVNFQQVSL